MNIFFFNHQSYQNRYEFFGRMIKKVYSFYQNRKYINFIGGAVCVLDFHFLLRLRTKQKIKFDQLATVYDNAIVHLLKIITAVIFLNKTLFFVYFRNISF